MSDDKKYYYLKLKDNFYNTEDIKILESMKNGYEYSSLYLKLCLLSLKGEGKLLYKNRIPYKSEMLATITGHKMEVIEFAIPIFQEMEMLIVLDNGTIFIDDMQNLIGHGSTEAERKAIYRKKINKIKEIGHCPDKRPPELELELELELEKEKELKAPIKVNQYHELLIFWNSQPFLITHSKDRWNKNLKKRHIEIIEDYGIDTVQESITIYNCVLAMGDDTYWTKRWPFWEWIVRGFEAHFLPEANPDLNTFRKKIMKKSLTEEIYKEP